MSIEQEKIKDYTDEEAQMLCAKLRQRLMKIISKTGGHFASNLGVVELTVAIHRVFDTKVDRLVFDVGHQCYVHKMLTGREEGMGKLRSLGGVAGYPKPSESDHDAFVAGHASCSVSVALGMARARTLAGEGHKVLALIGDGALTGGLAYEGLSNAGQSGEQLIVILNDNGMSIGENVGGVATYLANQRLRPQYLQWKKNYRQAMATLPGGKQIYHFTHKMKKMVKETILPCSMFEDMGFSYLGPVNGHDVSGLTQLLRYAKGINGPVLIHVRTVKGKGYTLAEHNPNQYHGVSPFSLQDGIVHNAPKTDFSAAFGQELCALAAEDNRICAITAAMEEGTGLLKFSKTFPERFFDVGIAEGHGVSMAAGLAKQGRVPIFAVYSTFLQRGYDMLLHDVGLEGLHVVLCVDRAGLVGEDGETHHGVFDVAYLCSVPNMTVLAPSSFSELKTMLAHAIHGVPGPVAVRYPRGGERGYGENSGLADSVCIRPGSHITLVGYGTVIGTLLSAAEALSAQGIDAEVVKLNNITSTDFTEVFKSIQKTKRLLVAEECVAAGSVGQRIATALLENNISPEKIALCNLGNQYVTHGTMKELLTLCGLDENSLYQRGLEVCGFGQ